eukprot:jgi/Botrbrau1/23144/Bobra.0437s0001.1
MFSVRVMQPPLFLQVLLMLYCFLRVVTERSTVSQLVTKLLPGTRLTVLCCPSDCGQFTVSPLSLAYYDFVLGKPWLTVFNPVVNWKLNAVSLIHYDKTHVLVGCQRSGIPEYVVSSMEVEELVKLGDPMYLIQLNAVTETSSDTNAYDVPELEQLLQEFKDVLSGLPQGLPPSRAGDHHIRLEPDATPPASRIYPLSGAVGYEPCVNDFMHELVHIVLPHLLQLLILRYVSHVV